MPSPLLIITFLLLLIGTILGGLAAGGVFNTQQPITYTPSPPPINNPNPSQNTPYINPQPFKTGYLTNPPQQVADLCNTTMYPIQQPYVDYSSDVTNNGSSSVNSNVHRNNHISAAIKNCGSCGECDVNIFNSPP